MGSTVSKPSSAPILDEKKAIKAEYPSENTLSINTSATAPQSSDGTLTLSNLTTWETHATSNPKTQLTRTVLPNTPLRSALARREVYVADRHVFNTEVGFKTGPVTNQGQSGRCWIFATMNVLRYEVMKKARVKEFQLSQVRFTW
jgi:bleomycin hydrolase